MLKTRSLIIVSYIIIATSLIYFFFVFDPASLPQDPSISFNWPDKSNGILVVIYSIFLVGYVTMFKFYNLGHRIAFFALLLRILIEGGIPSMIIIVSTNSTELRLYLLVFLVFSLILPAIFSIHHFYGHLFTQKRA